MAGIAPQGDSAPRSGGYLQAREISPREISQWNRPPGRLRTTFGRLSPRSGDFPPGNLAMESPPRAIPHSVGRQILPPPAQHPERRPELALGRLLVERVVDVGHIQRLDRRRELL